MAPDRIANAIDSLIAHVIPRDPNGDKEVEQERHDACFELVKTIIDRYCSETSHNLKEIIFINI